MPTRETFLLKTRATIAAIRSATTIARWDGWNTTAAARIEIQKACSHRANRCPSASKFAAASSAKAAKISGSRNDVKNGSDEAKPKVTAVNAKVGQLNNL